MGKDPDSIREEIVATRDRMAGTAEALVERADVPAHVKRALRERGEAAVTTVDDVLVGIGERGPGAPQPVDAPAEVPDHRAAARRRGLLILGGATVVIVTGTVGAVLIARRGGRVAPGRLAQAARGLPASLRSPVLPAARTADSWLERVAEGGRNRRDAAVRAVSEEIGRAVVAQERRQNPFWRRLARDVVTAAATTTATLTARHFVRSALGTKSTAE